MARAARDRLARTLRGDVQAAFSVELTAQTDDLGLEVEGFGQVRFPVTPAKARKLLGLGRPARFGRGEETLTDPDVRDTWEIPKHLVRAEWNDATLKDILATVKEELGLPNAAELTADLHSLLVYETNQHFLAHQDSEKDDSMVGTLVVTLPSSYAGGELTDVTLTHWTGPDGTRLEETSLSVDGDEVCASTQTGDLEPYSSEYEGYMGNWGNTLDRWYHRAAVVVWPRDQAFANRAETSPAWALDELAAMTSAGDVSGAQAAAATLLRPYRIENLTDAYVDSFGRIAGRYGQRWTAELLRTWFGGTQPAWA